MISADEGQPLPLWARPDPAPGRTQLSRDAVVTAAVDVADADGLPAVSMRRLASELGARVMTLYSYVASKEDLLDLMFDELARRTALGDARPAGWRAGLTAIAHRVREMGLAHPWSVDILGQRAQLGPNTLHLLDEWVATVAPLALEPGDAWQVVTAVNDYVTGYVIRGSAQRRAVPADPELADRWQREVGAYLGGVADSGAVPHIAPLLRAGFAAQEDAFDRGLGWLLDSIAASYDRSTGRTR